MDKEEYMEKVDFFNGLSITELYSLYDTLNSAFEHEQKKLNESANELVLLKSVINTKEQFEELEERIDELESEVWKTIDKQLGE